MKDNYYKFSEQEAKHLSSFYDSAIEPFLLTSVDKNKKFNCATIISKNLFIKLNYELNLFQLSPEDYEIILNYEKLDFVLIEVSHTDSLLAWNYYLDDKNVFFEKIKKIIKLANKNSIPTILLLDSITIYTELEKIFSFFDYIFVTNLFYEKLLNQSKVKYKRVNKFIQTKIYNPFIIKRKKLYNIICNYENYKILNENRIYENLLKENFLKFFNVNNICYDLDKSEINYDRLTFLQYLTFLKLSNISFHTPELLLSTNYQEKVLESGASKCCNVTYGDIKQVQNMKDIVSLYPNELEFNYELNLNNLDSIFFASKIHRQWRCINLHYSATNFMNKILSSIGVSSEKILKQAIVIAIINTNIDYQKFLQFVEQNLYNNTVYYVFIQNKIKITNVESKQINYIFLSVKSMLVPALQSILKEYVDEPCLLFKSEVTYSPFCLFDFVLSHENLYGDFYYKMKSDLIFNMENPDCFFSEQVLSDNYLLIGVSIKIMKEILFSKAIDYIAFELFNINHYLFKNDIKHICLDRFNLSAINEESFEV